MREAAPPRWSVLLAAAAHDDALAACRLAALLDDCRLVEDVAHMVETQLSMAVRSGRATRMAAAEIEALEAAAEPFRRNCEDAPPALVAAGWEYLLRAAQAGHAPSMLRFVAAPSWSDDPVEERSLAREAWRRQAPALLADLLQRGSPEALEVAYRAAQGLPLAGEMPLQARDPFAVLRLGTALAAVQEDDSNRSVELMLVERELTPAQIRQARSEGARLAWRFLSADASDSAPAGDDDCSVGWSGPATAGAAADD